MDLTRSGSTYDLEQSSCFGWVRSPTSPLDRFRKFVLAECSASIPCTTMVCPIRASPLLAIVAITSCCSATNDWRPKGTSRSLLLFGEGQEPTSWVVSDGVAMALAVEMETPVAVLVPLRHPPSTNLQVLSPCSFLSQRLRSRISAGASWPQGPL